MNTRRNTLNDKRRPAAENPAPAAAVGIVEWFRPGEEARVDRVLDDLAALGVSELRTGVSWPDYATAAGLRWYQWLLPHLAARVRVLPCLSHRGAWWGAAKTFAPPQDLRAFADFVDDFITTFGAHFEWIELWSQPNGGSAWPLAQDPAWFKFAEMVGSAAYWARQRNKKTLLGGMLPVDTSWLQTMCDRGLIEYIDAVGIHGFPVTFHHAWEGWTASIARVREVLQRNRSNAQVWVTETGYSTWRHDERRQLTAFIDAIDAPAERVFWYAAHDLNPTFRTSDGFDERDYHFGLKRFDGAAKLLFRIWQEGGLDAVRDAYWLDKAPAHAGSARQVLITGGAGFIGTNVAHRVASLGHNVLLLDNLSRPGVERNLHWLRQTHGDRVQIHVADVQDPHILRKAVAQASQVFHFAAQVAVTTSLTNSIHDFEVNARGTLNLLEAIRGMDNPPPLVFTSTNKVYGGLPDVKLRVHLGRYEPEDDHLRACGISERRPLDFHSPYGCSKGAADQYVLDYARTFGLPAVVFRMSCIYGLHQMGCEDQGWVAHFLIRALQNAPITLYGDGMQVRDILFVEDLVDAFLLAQSRMTELSGLAFNMGGGPANTISLLELLDIIGELHGKKPAVRFGAWRPGDQRYYVSDTSRFQHAAGWQPRVSARQGVHRLYAWLRDSLMPRTAAQSRRNNGRWPPDISPNRRHVDAPRSAGRTP
ncbi:MAG TPA: NAD-dependent epimerase/dehydratase family protein [Phycisphaerae bacterium]|nr:NAD-dependent epimerase/dehydratase family protein [Phycisphaerae bacterium]